MAAVVDQSSIVFTMRHSASTVYAGIVHLSASPSVTGRCSTETPKYRITQITPHNSLGTLGSQRQRSWRNSNGIIPSGQALLTSLVMVNDRLCYTVYGTLTMQKCSNNWQSSVCVDNTWRRREHGQMLSTVDQQPSPVDHTQRPAFCTAWSWAIAHGSVAWSIGVSRLLLVLIYALSHFQHTVNISTSSVEFSI